MRMRERDDYIFFSLPFVSFSFICVLFKHHIAVCALCPNGLCEWWYFSVKADLQHALRTLRWKKLRVHRFLNQNRFIAPSFERVLYNSLYLIRLKTKNDCKFEQWTGMISELQKRTKKTKTKKNRWIHLSTIEITTNGSFHFPTIDNTICDGKTTRKKNAFFFFLFFKKRGKWQQLYFVE